MESGVKSRKGLNLICCLSYSDCLLIKEGLKKKFLVTVLIEPTGNSHQYNIFIPEGSMIIIKNLVSDYFIPEMKYKLLT